MNKSYNRMTVFICILYGCIAVMILCIFTIIRGTQLVENKADHIYRKVKELEAEYAQKNITDMDQHQVLREYYTFLEDIKIELLNDTDDSFYATLYYNDGEFSELFELKDYETERLYKEDPALNWDDVRIKYEDFPVSDEAIQFLRKYYGREDWRKGLKEKWILQNTPVSGYFIDKFLRGPKLCEYYLDFVIHPLKLVIRENIIFYVIYILLFILWEWGTVAYRKKLWNQSRFRAHMASTMTTGFSHELKTPLAIMRASVENWDYFDEKDKPKYLQKVGDETEHLNQLIGKLLSISDMPSGEKVPFEEVDLYSIMQEVCDRLEPIMEERHLEVAVKAEHPENCVVNGDSEMMRIVMNNFISNAVKYSAHRIQVELLSGKKIRFSVTNDGNVLSKEETKRVWGLFYKSDKARTDRFGSSGVGLAVSKRILEIHKAKYGCISDNEKTTFWFEMQGTETNTK